MDRDFAVVIFTVNPSASSDTSAASRFADVESCMRIHDELLNLLEGLSLKSS